MSARSRVVVVKRQLRPEPRIVDLRMVLDRDDVVRLSLDGRRVDPETLSRSPFGRALANLMREWRAA